MEADKCEGWEWVGWEQIKAWANAMTSGGDVGGPTGESENKGVALFLPLLNLFQQRRGFDPVASFRDA